MKRKYPNIRPLREAAATVLKSRGFVVIEMKGTGGARLTVTQNGKAQAAHVRTSSDRWVGWMRDEQGDWRGLGDADLIVVATLTGDGGAEIFGFKPETVRAAFDANIAAREAEIPTLKKSAPVFVCLDPQDANSGAKAVASNLKAQALWREKISLGASAPEAGKTSSVQETHDGFAERVKREFAARVSVSVDRVAVEFRVTF